MKTETPLSPALERALELREERKSHRVIAEILEAEGVPLPPGRAKKWNHTTVGQLFQQLEATAPLPPPAPPITPVPGPAEVDTMPQPIDPNTPPEAVPPHSLTVKILGPWTHADSLFWDYLFRSAWEKIDQKTDHTLPLEDAIDNLLTITHRADAEHLWETVDRLAASRVKVESMVAHHPVAISTSLLSAVLTHNAVSFHFPPALVKLLKNPQRYTRFRTLFAVKH